MQIFISFLRKCNFLVGYRTNHANSFILHPHRHFFSKIFMAVSSDILKKKENIVIGTHNGTFHCDEALGCYLLQVLFPHACITRTRDPKILDSCDIVLDVGGIYDPQNHRYDHHQKTFKHTMSTVGSTISGNVRLSSAGLIYHHFGKDILVKILHSENETMINYVYQKMYLKFIREIDGIDNGIPAFDGEPLYEIHTHIGSRVKLLNQPWNSTEVNWNEDEHFRKAMQLVGQEFVKYAMIFKDVKYPAREIVYEAIQNRYNVHSSGEIIELRRSCPWKEHFFELEEIHKVEPQIKYVLFDSNDSYRIRGVPITPTSYLGRKFFPPSWRGLRDKELSEKANIDGCIFVHATGFIGGHATREGALKMAIKSLEMEV